ncbi:hypothetical protein [Rhizobium sp. G21]|uniref:hypothetical protein n=1 Tax=Rhizobium sp. G21 TaxID=2758439 RepID=UPI0015FF405C|nr:hypothetical protein [Rhizobium sp. G21]MBB1250206.1 hypothetical protein [Rhizobium sp. G21]
MARLQVRDVSLKDEGLAAWHNRRIAVGTDSRIEHISGFNRAVFGQFFILYNRNKFACFK